MITKDCVNLGSIVNYLYESEAELEPDNTKECFMNSKYESVRNNLNEIFKAIDFDSVLIKDMNQGYGGKGAYVFPRKDGEFVEFLIKFAMGNSGKMLRAGEYAKTDKDELKKVIDGLVTLMRDLDVPEEIVIYEQYHMEQKTMIHVSYQAMKIWETTYEKMAAIAHCMEVMGDFTPFDEQKKFWEDLSVDVERYLQGKVDEYWRIEQANKKEILKDAVRLTNEDIEFSKRSKDIINELHYNQEFMELKREYEDLHIKQGKNNIINYKKREARKQSILKKQLEIYRETARNQPPLSIDELSTLEKYMCVCEDHFHLTYISEEGKWAWHMNDKYYKDRHLLEGMNFDDRDGVASTIYYAKPIKDAWEAFQEKSK